MERTLLVRHKNKEQIAVSYSTVSGRAPAVRDLFRFSFFKSKKSNSF